MQQEVQMARDIQTRLLPKAPPVVAGYDIAGSRCRRVRTSAATTSTFWSFATAGMGLCLADVSGKGISASLLMANMQATIRGQAARALRPRKCLQHANQQLYQSTDSDKYVTMFYAVLDAAKHELQYSNAGHNPPLLIAADGQYTLLKTGGPVLGILPEAPFDQATVSLTSGDLLLIYSDGYTEAMNRSFEEFGEERLLEVVLANRNLPALN